MTKWVPWGGDDVDLYDDSPDPGDIPDLRPPRPLTPTEQRARFLTIDDPWDPALDHGRCPECGATIRHAGACTRRGGPGYTPPTKDTP